jgi:hypothetical protein
MENFFSATLDLTMTATTMEKLLKVGSRLILRSAYPTPSRKRQRKKRTEIKMNLKTTQRRKKKRLKSYHLSTTLMCTAKPLQC